MEAYLSDLPELKRLYKKAVKNKDYLFMFRGVEIITEYAKYMIEYMENKKKGR